MSTKKKIAKPSIAIEIQSKPVFNHYIQINKNEVSLCCQGNSKWIKISPMEDIANDLNFCPYCGAELDGLDLHKSISKLIKPSERFTG
jgi:hypothetical protein